MRVKAYWTELETQKVKSAMVDAKITGVSFSCKEPIVIFALDHPTDDFRRLTRKEIIRFREEGQIVGLTDREISLTIENAKTLLKQREKEYQQFLDKMIVMLNE